MNASPPPPTFSQRAIGLVVLSHFCFDSVESELISMPTVSKGNCLNFEYLRQKPRVTGPWEQETLVYANNREKILCLCT